MKAIVKLLLYGVTLGLTTSAHGQSAVEPASDTEVELWQQQAQSRQSQPLLERPGQVANSSVGQAGRRQTRDEAAPGIDPTARIANRIANRVQSRIRNRIDQNYDPQANAQSPFVVAENEERAAAARQGSR